MGNDPLSGPTLIGVVEVDETLVGGKAKGKGRALQGQQRRGSPEPSSAAGMSVSSASLT